jgi:hypothetical protein
VQSYAFFDYLARFKQFLGLFYIKDYVF